MSGSPPFAKNWRYIPDSAAADRPAGRLTGWLTDGIGGTLAEECSVSSAWCGYILVVPAWCRRLGIVLTPCGFPLCNRRPPARRRRGGAYTVHLCRAAAAAALLNPAQDNGSAASEHWSTGQADAPPAWQNKSSFWDVCQLMFQFGSTSRLAGLHVSESRCAACRAGVFFPVRDKRIMKLVISLFYSLLIFA